MKPLNKAQQLLIALGFDQMRIIFGSHKRGRLASNTKKGPGRIHLDGKKESEEEKETK